MSLVSGASIGQSIKEYRKRRFDRAIARLDEDDDGQWITTKNRHKVHLNEEGEPDKGNPHVIDAMNGHKVVQGKDISKTWKRRPDKFEYAIDDVLDAQGFNGKPRVVGQKEFREAVKAANGGKGFIAMRAYAAPTKEIADGYRNDLYNGEFYANCKYGSATYGQGMYSYADYTGNVTNRMRSEMKYYPKHWGQGENGVAYVEKFTLDPSAKIISWEECVKRSQEYKLKQVEKPALESVLGNVSDKEKRQKLSDIYPLYQKRKSDSESEAEYNKMREQFGLDEDEVSSFAKAVRKEQYRLEYEQFKLGNQIGDNGVFWALRGYDAIDVPLQKGGSYTIILNRTKCIFLRPKDWHGDSDEEPITFKRNKDGEVEAWRGKKLLGVVHQFGDEPLDAESDEEDHSVKERRDSVDRFRERRAMRLKMRTDAEDDGIWRTTDNGHKIHINEEGEVDKGNPHVVEKIEGTHAADYETAKSAYDTKVESLAEKHKKEDKKLRAKFRKAEKEADEKLKPAQGARIEYQNRQKQYGVFPTPSQEEELDSLKNDWEAKRKEYLSAIDRREDARKAVLAEQSRFKKEVYDSEEAKAYRGAVLSKFPTYNDCKTSSEVVERMNANGYLNYESNVTGLEELNVDTARKIASNIEDCCDKCPPLKGVLTSIQCVPIENHSSLGVVYADSNGTGIRFNSRVFKDIDRYEQLNKISVESQFHPEGTDLLSVVYHEMSHTLDNQLSEKVIVRGKGRFSTMIFERVRDRLGMTDKECRDGVSKYASYGAEEGLHKEFFAEAYMEYLTSPHPRKVAQAVGEEVEKELRKRGLL